MTNIIRSKRTPYDPDADVVTARYVVVTDAGTFTVSKEFYAQGPSMFDWVIDGPDYYINNSVMMPELRFSTKKAAMRCIFLLPEPGHFDMHEDITGTWKHIADDHHITPCMPPSSFGEGAATELALQHEKLHRP